MPVLHSTFRQAGDTVLLRRGHSYGRPVTLVYFFLSFCSVGQMKARMTSNRYGLLQIGLHMRYNEDIRSRVQVVYYQENVFSVQIAFCNLKRVKEESPVIANQLSCGEQVLKFCTNRPSRSGRGSALSASEALDS